MTGLFFGSFNPIHTGHLIIASYMANYTDLQEVWFVVSPQNPLKTKKSLASMYDRLEMVNLAIGETEKLRASDIEFRLPQPSYTIDTLTYLQERYPGKRFVLIMGSDNLQSLAKWKNYEFILHNYPIFVYRRPGHDVVNNFKEGNITILDAPLLQISATHIRNCIKQGKSIRYLVPDKVLEEIQQNRYYL